MVTTMRRMGLAVLLLGFLGYVVFRGTQRTSDFKYPYGAARLLWLTGELHPRAQPRYPLTLHVMLAPLTAIPFMAAVALWSVLSIAAVACLPILFAELSGIAPREQVPAWLLTGPFFLDALVLGQFDPINLFLVTAGLLTAHRGRGTTGAWLIGIAGLIKFLPAIHWVTLLARRRRPDVILGVILTAITGLALILAAVGWNGMQAALARQFELMRTREGPANLVARGSDLRPNNESLPITLARSLGELSPGKRDHRTLVLARLPLEHVWIIWKAILAILAIFWTLSLIPAAHLEQCRGTLAVFGLTSIFMLAATPICWHHYFLWTLPAAMFLSGRPRFLLASAVISLGVTAWPAARASGLHMLIALALYGLVVRDMFIGSRGGSSRYTGEIA